MTNIESVLSFINKPFNQTQEVTFNSKKFFLRKRSKYSDAEAINLVSKHGISDVIDINEYFVLETFVNFEKINLSLDEYIPLLQNIHSEKKNGLFLVHGDFSKFNTTNFNNKPLIFDYEHAHWGNRYEDIGRIILRETRSIESSLNFLESYFDKVPEKKELRKGLMSFCYWQNKIRLEKNIPYANIPLKRAKQVFNSENSYDSIIKKFKIIN